MNYWENCIRITKYVVVAPMIYILNYINLWIEFSLHFDDQKNIIFNTNATGAWELITYGICQRIVYFKESSEHE